MKKIFALFAALMLSIASASAISYDYAARQAYYLTDKMAYELNLTDAQYEEVYRINLEYFLKCEVEADINGYLWEYRNSCLSRILYTAQWRLFLGYDFLYRPLRWVNNRWHFPMYKHYGHTHFYRPTPPPSYRGPRPGDIRPGGPRPGDRHDGYRGGGRRGDYRPGGNPGVGNGRPGGDRPGGNPGIGNGRSGNDRPSGNTGVGNGRPGGQPSGGVGRSGGDRPSSQPSMNNRSVSTSSSSFSRSTSSTPRVTTSGPSSSSRVSSSSSSMRSGSFSRSSSSSVGRSSSSVGGGSRGGSRAGRR